MSDRYRAVSGVIFGIISLVHALRALSKMVVYVGTLEIPVWVSWIAVVAMGGLCIWAFASRRK